jgi:hypothetical protein
MTTALAAAGLLAGASETEAAGVSARLGLVSGVGSREGVAPDAGIASGADPHPFRSRARASTGVIHRSTRGY